MFGWYKIKKFYPAGEAPAERYDREYENDGQQWSDPEEHRKQLFYPLLTKNLEKGKKYLDVGCGLGGWLAFLRVRGFDVQGVDRSKRAVELIKELDPSLPVQSADISQLPFEDGSFDGYMAIGAWEFDEDGTEALAREAHRVLKAGGTLFLEVPYANPFRRWTYLPLKTLQVFIRTHLFGQTPIFAYHLFRKGDILELLKEVGFEVTEMNPHELPETNSHYGLWVDWPFLRGKRPYELNGLGMVCKRVLSSISPWMISTGIFFVAKKK